MIIKPKFCPNCGLEIKEVNVNYNNCPSCNTDLIEKENFAINDFNITDKNGLNYPNEKRISLGFAIIYFIKGIFF